MSTVTYHKQTISKAIESGRAMAHRQAMQAGYNFTQCRGYTLGGWKDREKIEAYHLMDADLPPTLDEIKSFIAEYQPDEVYIDGGFDGADTKTDFSNSIYDPMIAEWSVELDPKTLEILNIESF